MKVCREKEPNLCCFFLWRVKRAPVFMAGAFVILLDFKLQGLCKVAARLMLGWHDRIPYRTGGFEYGYKLYH